MGFRATSSVGGGPLALVITVGSIEMLELVILVFLGQFLALARHANLHRVPGRPFAELISYIRSDHESEIEDLETSACGGRCRHVLIRTLRSVREGPTDAPWISEARMLRRGL